MTEVNDVLENVKEYYGKVLKSSDDMKTQMCITPGRAITKYVCEAISSVHPDVTSRYYGCGLVIPPLVARAKVLDLGSGSGRDCFALSKLVGEAGEVIGIDMTDEQIKIANEYVDYHTQKYGYAEPNVKYVQGFIENLTGAGLSDNYFDIIVSNCVLNLSPDKLTTLCEAFKVLKDGGEMYFSDMNTDTYLSDEVRKHRIMWGEGFSGALHWQDFNKLADKAGFSKAYIVSVTAIPVDREDFKAILGDAKYCSVTYRLFKLPKDHKEYADSCVIYKGGIPGHEDMFLFDHATKLTAGKSPCLSGDRVTCLKYSRFAEYFEFQSEFACSVVTPRVAENPFGVLAGDEKASENRCGLAAKGKC